MIIEVFNHWKIHLEFVLIQCRFHLQLELCSEGVITQSEYAPTEILLVWILGLFTDFMLQLIVHFFQI